MFRLLMIMALGTGTALSGADISPRWDGVETTSCVGIFLTLNQLGQDVSGTVSTSDSPTEVPISHGAFAGNELSFEVQDSDTNQTVKFHLSLQDHTLDGQKIIGDRVSRVTFWPAPRSTAYPINPGVTSAPELLLKTEPEYTEEARASGVQGVVVVKLAIGCDGIVIPGSITVVRSLGMGLDEKAVECVKQWRFRPGYRDGKPVATPATIELNFRLHS